MGNPVLVVDEKLCVECALCSLACSMTKSDVMNVKIGRVRSVKQWPEAPSITVCRHGHCEGKWCIGACPTEAIEMQEGVLSIEMTLCNGCGECVPACPYGAIYINEEDWKAVVCDLCGGGPACAPACPTEALVFGEYDHAE